MSSCTRSLDHACPVVAARPALRRIIWPHHSPLHACRRACHTLQLPLFWHSARLTGTKGHAGAAARLARCQLPRPPLHTCTPHPAVSGPTQPVHLIATNGLPASLQDHHYRGSPGRIGTLSTHARCILPSQASCSTRVSHLTQCCAGVAAGPALRRLARPRGPPVHAVRVRLQRQRPRAFALQLPSLGRRVPGLRGAALQLLLQQRPRRQQPAPHGEHICQHGGAASHAWPAGASTDARRGHTRRDAAGGHAAAPPESHNGEQQRRQLVRRHRRRAG